MHNYMSKLAIYSECNLVVLKNLTERTPSPPHGTHSPSTLWVAVCLHQGKLESDLGQGQTYSTHGIP